MLSNLNRKVDEIATVVKDQIIPMVNQIVPMVNQIVPMVCNLQIEKNNLWVKSGRSSVTSSVGRDSLFRQNLLKSLGYEAAEDEEQRTNKRQRRGLDSKEEFKSASDDLMPVCMVTGAKQEVEAAHIVPVSAAKVDVLKSLSLDIKNINDVRNGLLLVRAIHRAFDALEVAFVRSNPLSVDLHLKIFNDDCRDKYIFTGSTHTIGEYDGCKLVLNGHSPYLRALSYHAYMAYLRNSHIDSPLEYGSEEDCDFFRTRKLMRDAVISNIEREIEEEEEDND